MLLRHAEPRDDEPIARLTNTFIDATTIHFGLAPIGASDVRAERAAGGGRFPWFVAEDAGAFAGYAKAAVWRPRDAYLHTAEVSVYVEESRRRRGVATALYERLLAELARRRFRTAVAAVTLPNGPSVRFHESLGFERVGVFREVGRKFDAWWDVGFWQRPL